MSVTTINRKARRRHMVELFNDIGLGQWFRYVIGIVEVIGAVALVAPGLIALGGTLTAMKSRPSRGSSRRSSECFPQNPPFA
jgi:hypothetical protein